MDNFDSTYWTLLVSAHVQSPENTAYGLFLAAMDRFMSHPSDADSRKIAVVAFLALAEEEPYVLKYAVTLCSAAQDRELLTTVQKVIATRRDGDAMDLMAFVAPDMRVPITPWEEVDRPYPSTIGQLDEVLAKRGAKRLLTVAEPTDADPFQRPVAIVLCSDGTLELVKEIMDESKGPLGLPDAEHGMLLDLFCTGYNPGVEVNGFDMGNGFTYLRRSFAYGRVLGDTRWHSGCGVNQACALGASIARHFEKMHGRGILFLDTHPGNFLVDGTPFDFGHSRRFMVGAVDTFIMDPVYVAPEVVLSRTATTATDIFSLGVLVHIMLTGEHPFVPGVFPSTRAIGSGRLTYGVPNALAEYNPGKITDPALVSFLGRMLAKDPTDRPKAKEVAEFLEALGHSEPWPLQRRGRFDNKFEAPIALLLMRCGVPHKGHVNLICRLMDLGFFVQVSLQMTYTWTDKDPLPKWVVAKMLREAVRQRGYPLSDLDIVFTPFEDLRTQHLHFLMLPTWENVRVIVSGNPQVHELMAPICDGRPVITSQALCGDLTDANGTRLRTAMLAGDSNTVREMLPAPFFPGWHKLLDMFPTATTPPIDFPVAVSATVREGDRVFHQGIPVRRYEDPEAAVIRRIEGELGITDKVLGYPHTTLTGKGASLVLVYTGQVYDMEKETLEIFYRLEPV